MRLFSRIFKPKKQPVIPRMDSIQLNANFTPFCGNAYESDIYRGAVDAISRNVAKLKGSHIIKSTGGRREGSNSLNRLLQVRPNSFMSAFDCLYRLVTHYYLYNNAFAFLQRDTAGNVTGIYPMKPASVEFLTDSNDVMFCKLIFNDGNTYTLPYSDILHLRRHYNNNDLFGDNNGAILPGLELAHTQNEGLVQGIKTGAHLRGILRFTQILSGDNLKQEKERFMRDYFQMDNDGGIIVTDAKADYSPIEQKPYPIDVEQLQATRRKIYSYLGVSEKIIESNFSEQEYNAFYEAIVTPLAIQLSLEFTSKIFTDREIAFGNTIIFESNRLQFASAKTKAAIITQLTPVGLLSVNEAREILGLSDIADGDRRLVSLNFVHADVQDEYQLSEG